MKLMWILILALVLGSCDQAASDARARAPIVIGIWSQLTSLDPHQAQSPTELMVASSLYLGLVKIDASGQIVPGVAQSWAVSPDGKSYIFRLQKSSWSNGKPITSATFEYALKQLFAPNRISPWAKYFADIVNGDEVLAGTKLPSALGVRALSPDVLEIQLAQPQPALLALLASPAGAPVAPGQRLALPVGKISARAFPVNGPYKIELASAKNMMLVPNYNYVLPGAERRLGIDLRIQTDAAQAMAAFLENELGILDAQALPADVLRSKGRLRDQLMLTPARNVVGLGFNIKSRSLRKPALRRALSMLIDRDALLAANPQLGPATPRTSILPPVSQAFGGSAEPDWAGWTPTQKIDEGRRLLVEAGITLARPLVVQMIYPQTPESAASAAWLASALAPYNIKIMAVGFVPGAEFEDAFADGKYDAALLGWSTAVDNAEALLQEFNCRSGISTVCDVQVTRAFADARSTSDLALRSEKFRQAARLLSELVPAAPLYAPAGSTLVSVDLAGWPMTSAAPVALERLARRSGALQ